MIFLVFYFTAWFLFYMFLNYFQMKTFEVPVAVFIFALKRDNVNYPCAGEGDNFLCDR